MWPSACVNGCGAACGSAGGVNRCEVVRSALGRIRTCDTGFRRAVLYPLSYEGGGPM